MHLPQIYLYISIYLYNLILLKNLSQCPLLIYPYHIVEQPPPPPTLRQINIYTDISPPFTKTSLPQIYLYISIYLYTVQINLTNKLINPLDLQFPPHNIFLPCTKLPYRYMLFNSPDKCIFKPYL